MKKKLEDYKKRALRNLTKIKGGGEDGPIDRDKIRKPRNGTKL
ncbi:hypothetical protein SAMN04487911_12826 [Arenibacter nanhaiticus]|uniref:Uncharacterized protein n=1 Tax=Arenibacter nanhaiticus TaxID=558155 RepID=A0A1M6KWS9_9FLAO|nr:hypothetical protein [Arenibacter nanhaiticus]SHJ63362.1 hypothetical protein SAMN04487911_12826 [Arenibacter nanhaiticus]